jgi:threonine/homoserine/homoserine lactone efflux protein
VSPARSSPGRPWLVWQTPLVDQALAFLAISALVIVTPGQDTVLTIRHTLAGGRRAGIATALGVSCGQAVWTVATSAGVSALLIASEPIFVTVKLLGAAYLIYLGLQSLWSAVTGSGHRDAISQMSPGRLPPTVAFRRGVLSNLSNPKMAIFFSSLLPQFVPTGGPSFLVLLGLGLVFCTMTLSWLAGYAMVVARAGDVLRRGRVRRRLEAVTGAALVALGIGLVLEPRRS